MDKKIKVAFFTALVLGVLCAGTSSARQLSKTASVPGACRGTCSATVHCSGTCSCWIQSGTSGFCVQDLPGFAKAPTK